MNILTEIYDIVEMKLNKYRDSGLSVNVLNKLTDDLIAEAVSETMFSEKTITNQIGLIAYG